MSLITTYITADAAGVFKPWSVCLVNNVSRWRYAAAAAGSTIPRLRAGTGTDLTQELASEKGSQRRRLWTLPDSGAAREALPLLAQPALDPFWQFYRDGHDSLLIIEGWNGICAHTATLITLGWCIEAELLMYIFNDIMYMR